MSKSKVQGPTSKVAEKPVPFRAEMTRVRNRVLEHLTGCGYAPHTTAENANQVDWQHALLECVSEVAFEARFDLDDPVVIKAMKTKLAITAAACEMWADQLEGLE